MDRDKNVERIRRMLTRAALEGTLNRLSIQPLENDILIGDYCHVIKVSKKDLKLDANELIERGMYPKDNLQMSLESREDETEYSIVGELLPRHMSQRLYELYSDTTDRTVYVRKDLIDEYGEGIEIHGKGPCDRLRIWRLGEGSIGAVMPMYPNKVRGLY